MRLSQLKITTNIGPLFLVGSAHGLRGVHWEEQSIPKQNQPIDPCLEQAALEIEAYLTGSRRSFEVPLDLAGTPFQMSVWKELCNIPYGQTCSYKDLARRIGKPRAIRAVGTANGRNPLCLIVPCHRVIASDGGLGGYSGGLDLKEKLLQLEQKFSPMDRQ